MALAPPVGSVVDPVKLPLALCGYLGKFYCSVSYYVCWQSFKMGTQGPSPLGLGGVVSQTVRSA